MTNSVCHKKYMYKYGIGRSDQAEGRSEIYRFYDGGLGNFPFDNALAKPLGFDMSSVEWD